MVNVLKEWIVYHKYNWNIKLTVNFLNICLGESSEINLCALN